MIRSRRLVLAALGVALALTACGDPNTTTPLADQPPVIELASGQTGASGGAPASMAAADDAAESKMSYMAPAEFVYDGELPVLDGPAGSWFFPAGQTADLDRIAKLAASLGVEGDVRTLTADYGGGWAVGPEDYSAPVLSVSPDGMLTWYFSGATSTMRMGCATSGVADVAVGSSGSGSSGVAVDVAPATEAPVDTTAVVDPIPTDVVAPDCPVEQPPVGVPTKDEALAKANELFAEWGYDVGSYQFDDGYADEWGAYVNAFLLLDGMKAPVTLSVGFGENGVVTYASGYLAEPERGADYPTIGATAGLERLKTQQSQYLGFDQPAIMESSGTAIGADGVATDAAVAAVAPDVMPCEPESARAECAPVDLEPVTVTLNSVTRDLTMVWAADNTIWLLPAYTFGTADGGMYTVIAVEDAYIHQADPEVASTDPVVVDPGVVSGSSPPDPTACPTFETPTDITTPGLDVSWAQRWIGQCLSYAEEEAAVLGWSVRVVRQDGVDLAVTEDFSDTRFNVAVKGDIITEVLSVG